jgi:hypothetical protein
MYVSIVLNKRSINHHAQEIRNPALCLEITDSVRFTLFSQVILRKYWDSSYKKILHFSHPIIQSRHRIRHK